MTKEYILDKLNNKTIAHIRKRNINFEKYFSDFKDNDPLNFAALDGIIAKSMQNSAQINITDKLINNEIVLTLDCTNDEIINQFVSAFLDALADFYEEHEVHVTRMFGSFIYLKRINGDLKAVHATPIPIKYCPLTRQMLLEVGGDTAKNILSSMEDDITSSQPEMMCRLVDDVVIKGGYFDTSRPLNSCEANVLFGASETMSSAFRNGLIDAAVIVSNNLGTIITTDFANTQGAVKRMTGLFATSPSKQILKTAYDANIIPLYPHTACIDQPEGVKTAVSLGCKNIAVSVAWEDNVLLEKISALEKDGITIYKFGVCSTGIDDKTAEIMAKNADLVWSCASKAVLNHITPNSIAQVGVKIPVYIMSEKGWALAKNHLKIVAEDRGEDIQTLENLTLKKGPEKPVILNDANKFKVIPAKNLNPCSDCPHPYV